MSQSFRLFVWLLVLLGLLLGLTGCQAAPLIAPMVVPAVATGPVGTVIAITVFIVGSLIVAVAPTGSQAPPEVPADAVAIDAEWELTQPVLVTATAVEVLYAVVAKPTEKKGSVALDAGKIDYTIRCNPQQNKATVTLHFVHGDRKNKLGETVEIPRPNGCVDLQKHPEEVKAILREAIAQNKALAKLLQSLIDFLG